MKTWRKVLLIALSIAALIVCAGCCWYIWQYISGERFHEQLRESAVGEAVVLSTSEPTPYITQEEEAVEQITVVPTEENALPQMSISIDFNALKAVNEDIYAWIEVPGTIISYAVVQHPTDELFYNSHNVDKSYYSGGSIFSQTYNTKDFTDPVTVLYGHNLKSNRMFSQLWNFADTDFFAENRYIYIYTPEKVYQYEIFAACPCASHHLLLCYDFEEEESFLTFFDTVHTSTVDTNLADDSFPGTDDRVLVLSTCYERDRYLRYLVMGVLTAEYEVVEADDGTA